MEGGGLVGRQVGEGGTLPGVLSCFSIMDPPPPMTMIHEDEEPPSDFEVAKRVARRLWGFSDAAISFAGSSESTRGEFVAWVKFNLRQFEKKRDGRQKR